MTTGRAPRVAIVGPRRVRTGLGPFIAKHLVAHGAVVPAFIASRRESVAEGAETLRGMGIEARGHTDLDALLAADPVDALVVASPQETHLGWIEAAIARDLAVLCEKPFVWAPPRRPLEFRPVETSSAPHEAARLLAAAAQRDLTVFENCPWPYALPAFDALHPGVRAAGVRTLGFEMAPSTDDPVQMLVAALSHPLSVLQACRPAAATAILVRRWGAVAEGRVEVTFSVEFGGAFEPILATVRLATVPTQPRPMALVVNGARAERRLDMSDYSMRFADGAREVPLPDPMAALVGDFVRALRDGDPEPARRRRAAAIASRLTMLCELVGSFPSR